MSEPTTYDLIQDTRIQGVEDLVQTTYTPFQGPEFSYPVVHQPMDDEMWQYVTLGMGSGVLDVGGWPYRLTGLSDVTDTGRLSVATTTGTAQAILRGFYHRLNQDITLSFPPVSQKTLYQVVLEYDPLRHKEPGGPIRVRVLTSLDWSGGKHYLPLWDVERDPSQLLSQAKVTNRASKIAPVIICDYPDALPDPKTQLWGTICYIRHGMQAGRVYMAGGTSAPNGGPAEWELADKPVWQNITLRGGYGPAFQQPQWSLTSDGAIQTRGSVKRLSGALITGRLENFGWLPASISFDGMTSTITGGTGSKVVRVETSGSRDLVYYTDDLMQWMSLDGFKAWVQ